MAAVSIPLWWFRYGEPRLPNFASPRDIDRAIQRATQKADPSHGFEYSCDCERCRGTKVGPPPRPSWWDGDRVRYDVRPEGPPAVDFTPEQIAENLRAEVARWYVPPKLRLVK